MFTQSDLIKRLKLGQTICVDRRDAPELKDLQELEDKGLVFSKLFDYPEQQYSVLKFRWKEGGKPF